MGSTSTADVSAQLQQLASDLLDAAKSYEPGMGQAGLKSRIEITSKAKRMLSIVSEPVEEPFRLSANMAEILSIRALMKMHAFEHIPHEGAISSADLAKKIGSQESLLARLLRMLVALGILQQTENGDYAHTKNSMIYTSALGSFFSTMYDVWLTPFVKFPKYLMKFGLVEPTSQTENPMSWGDDQFGKNPWEIISQDPEWLEAFDTSMKIQEDVQPVLGIYDFNELTKGGVSKDKKVLVDVGGGRGHAITQILEAHPDIPASGMVLQDRAPVIEAVDKSGDLPKEVEKSVIDFFKEQPVKGATSYYLRRVLHDFSDADCATILKPIASAMSQDSKLLLSEMVVPSRPTDADVPVYWMDLCMMNLGGKERTEENWADLLATGGLKIVKIWRAVVGPQTVIEACLA